ncbi:hypothetical protein, partial [Bradyrhizobium sp.]|uniref:hypothetical protein n=1 Tax=Bradyrhizobium sp. TaxID=376 RepID=UPI003C6EF3B8
STAGFSWRSTSIAYSTCVPKPLPRREQRTDASLEVEMEIGIFRNIEAGVAREPQSEDVNENVFGRRRLERHPQGSAENS